MLLHLNLLQVIGLGHFRKYINSNFTCKIRKEKGIHTIIDKKREKITNGTS